MIRLDEKQNDKRNYSLGLPRCAEGPVEKNDNDDDNLITTTNN